MSDSLTGTRRLIPGIASITDALSRFAWPVLRIGTGLMAVPHGLPKWGIGGPGTETLAKALFGNYPIMPPIAWLFFIGGVEIIGGLLLTVGLFTRVAAFFLFCELTYIWSQIHFAAGLFWTNKGYEYPLLWSLCALLFMIRGGGEYSLDAKLGKEI